MQDQVSTDVVIASEDCLASMFVQSVQLGGSRLPSTGRHTTRSIILLTVHHVRKNIPHVSTLRLVSWQRIICVIYVGVTLLLTLSCRRPPVPLGQRHTDHYIQENACFLFSQQNEQRTRSLIISLEISLKGKKRRRRRAKSSRCYA